MTNQPLKETICIDWKVNRKGDFELLNLRKQRKDDYLRICAYAYIHPTKKWPRGRTLISNLIDIPIKKLIK